MIFNKHIISIHDVQDMVGKLEDKTEMYKRMADNAEEMANENLAKLWKAQVTSTK
jgi:UDP-N-acetylglucosamine:LPS N-acetylglucosamine transferase